MSRKRPGSRHFAALDKATWARARLACLQRDGYRCRRCGKASALEAHHVTPLEKGGAAYDLANLEALCRGCHIEEHRPALSPERAAWRKLLEETT
ncbi:MAG: HNH endonuclease [Boseongicola sp.]|nr:HNH endonuclease [Boseongicola sp.]